MRRTTLLTLFLMVALAGCGNPASTLPEGAGDPVTTSSSGATDSDAGEPTNGTAEDPPPGGGGLVLGPDSGVGAQICAILSTDEIAALAGSAVREGQVSGPLGSACSWDFETTGVVLVQVMIPAYWDSFPDPSDSRYQKVEGIGTEAFVQPGLVSGWTAAALYEDRLVLADVSGPTATPELAAAVLRGVVGKLVG